MRFCAPPRGAIAAAMFRQPIFDGLQAQADLLTALPWPSVAELDVRFGTPTHPYSGRSLRLVEQSPAVLDDGLHYESRIFERGLIATRSENWHDLLNTLIWCTALPVKAAMNLRQHRDIQHIGIKQRTRSQCALTHFDEAGVLVVLREASRLAAWDGHDWDGLFLGLTTADFAIAVIGHALLEHALEPQRLIVGKALVAVHPEPHQHLPFAVEQLAAAIAAQRCLRDPQELRPLPLSGLPGWHARAGEAAFHAQAPCFQPVRADRRYPPALAPWGVSQK